MKNDGKKYSQDDDGFLKENYASMSHAKIGEVLGRSASSIRNKCYQLGYVQKENLWNDCQLTILREAYSGVEYSEDLPLNDIAKKIGKLKSNVCRKARQLGLTNASREDKKNKKVRIPKFSSKEELSKHISVRMKIWIVENGHPKGSLGMKHTKESLEKISKASKSAWANKTESQRDDMSKRASINGLKNTTNRNNASWGCGWREIGGIRKYYRSKWEANYARYLQWLKERGEIMGWEHEPHTFWFEGIKRGCLSYLPDFRVTENGGSIAYHEVKGWMDDRSKTKIKRMAKYHPSVKLIVVEAKAYASIKKTMQPFIKEWEVDSKGR